MHVIVPKTIAQVAYQCVQLVVTTRLCSYRETTYTHSYASTYSLTCTFPDRFFDSYSYRSKENSGLATQYH